MADYLTRAQMTLHHISGVAVNDVVNTFYFDSDDLPALDHGIVQGDIHDALLQLYTFLGPYLSDALTGGYTLKIYNMRDPEPRVPDGTVIGSFPKISPDAINLPGEVAVCASFRASLASGVPVGTRRGRIFFGPLNSDATEISLGRVRVNTAFRDGLRDQMLDLGRIDYGGPAVGSTRHSIYSPTWNLGRAATPKGSPAIAPHTIDESFNDVVHGWIDDALDTQRRRGEDPQARSTYDVPL